MAELPRDGREYFHWPVSAASVGVVFEASVGGTWVATTRTTDTITLLLEGPDVAALDRDPSAVVLAVSERIRFRVKDNPEIIVRGRGWVELVTE